MHDPFKAGPFLVQPDLNSLTGPEGIHTLEPKAMQVLLCLSDRAGQVVGKDEILQAVWPETFVTEDVLKNAVWELRKAFGDDARNPSYIQTIPKKGYRLIAPVSFPAVPPKAGKGGWILRLALAAAAAVLVLLAAYLAWDDRPVVSSPNRTRLAVLPFASLDPEASADSGPEQLADGMTIELITLLGRLDPEHLGVIAPLSALHYKTAGKDLAQVAGELRVDYLVEGSLQMEGERLRVHAQLSRAADQTQLWADNYLRDDVSGLLDVQMELAAAIAAEIQLRLQSQPASGVDRSRNVNSQAYQAFLEGNHHQFMARDFDKAVDAFQQAVDLDPGYALAHAKLAYAVIWGSRISPRQSLQKARQSARTALQLAPHLAEAHMAEGLVQLYEDLDWAGAEESLLRALQLDPGNAMAHMNYSKLLAASGRLKEAVAAAERARDLDPLSTLAARQLARLLYLSRDYPRAVEVLQEALQLDEGSPGAHLSLAFCYEALEDVDNAFQHRLRYLRLSRLPAELIEEVSRLYEESGYPAVLRRWIQMQEEWYQNRGYLISTALAALNVQLGQYDEALDWLERACQDHTRDLIYLRVDPDFDPLRSSSRFEELVSQIGAGESRTRAGNSSRSLR